MSVAVVISQQLLNVFVQLANKRGFKNKNFRLHEMSVFIGTDNGPDQGFIFGRDKVLISAASRPALWPTHYRIQRITGDHSPWHCGQGMELIIEKYLLPRYISTPAFEVINCYLNRI
jgi:hypothetical protein